MMCGKRGAYYQHLRGIYAERITALAGPTNAIFKAFLMIIYELEEDISTIAQLSVDRGNPEPDSLCYQCGSLIKKSGFKIKDI